MRTDMLGDATIIVALLSFILPPCVSYLRGRNTAPEKVGAIVFVVVFVAAGLSLFLQDAILNPPALDSTREYAKYYLLNFLAVFALAVAFYKGFWQTLGASVTEKLEATGPQP